MKHIGRKGMAFLLALMMVFSMSSAMAYTAQSTQAIKVKDAITVDGDLSDWDTTSPVIVNSKDQIVRDPGQWEDANDCSFEVYTMWTEIDLYIAMKMLDDTPLMYREGFPPDMADSLVVFFSVNPEADPGRTAYEATDFRYTQIIDDYDFFNGIDRDMVADQKGFESQGPDGDRPSLVLRNENFEPVDEDGEATDEPYDMVVNAEFAVKEMDGGYIYESRIPWNNFSNSEIPVFVPAAGMTIGFEIGMFDLDFPCPGVATLRMQWSSKADENSNVYADTDPSHWGTLTFVEK